LQNYKYRGIDGLYDLLSPIFASHGLVIIPTALEHHREIAGQTKSGANTYAVIVKMQYKICHIHNEQFETAIFYGEAMDTSDKATNKAKTAAYKYMAFELFNIPIDGADNDADNHNLETKKPQQVITITQLKDLYAIKKQACSEDLQQRIEAVLAGNDANKVVAAFNHLKTL
jgi:hypothetical protein